MNNRTRELITDLKAAARIGHPDSLEAALDGLRELPEVAGNQTLGEGFLENVILSAGVALANPMVEPAFLKKLAKDPLAALRAVAAAALGKKYSNGDEVTEGDLRSSASDRREEVSEALVKSLIQAEAEVKLLALAKTWVKRDSLRQQACGVRLLGTVARTYPDEALALLACMDDAEDPDLRATMVDTVSTMANDGLAEDVLGMLKAWVEEESQNPWVVTHALIGAWAAEQSERALSVLQRLTEKTGAERQVVRAIESLKRHGAEEAVAAAMEAWRMSDNPDLREIAKRMEQE